MKKTAEKADAENPRLVEEEAKMAERQEEAEAAERPEEEKGVETEKEEDVPKARSKCWLYLAVDDRPTPRTSDYSKRPDRADEGKAAVWDVPATVASSWAAFPVVEASSADASSDEDASAEEWPDDDASTMIRRRIFRQRRRWRKRR